MSKKVAIYDRVCQPTDKPPIPSFTNFGNLSVGPSGKYTVNTPILDIQVKIPNAPRSPKCSTTLAAVSSICYLYGNLTGSLVL